MDGLQQINTPSVGWYATMTCSETLMCGPCGLVGKVQWVWCWFSPNRQRVLTFKLRRRIGDETYRGLMARSVN